MFFNLAPPRSGGRGVGALVHGRPLAFTGTAAGVYGMRKSLADVHPRYPTSLGVFKYSERSGVSRVDVGNFNISLLL
jgi:hypothetical protein